MRIREFATPITQNISDTIYSKIRKFESSHINLVDLFFASLFKKNEHNELTPFNPLKLKFTVLPKLFKKWHMILTLVVLKKLS